MHVLQQMRLVKHFDILSKIPCSILRNYSLFIEQFPQPWLYMCLWRSLGGGGGGDPTIIKIKLNVNQIFLLEVIWLFFVDFDLRALLVLGVLSYLITDLFEVVIWTAVALELVARLCRQCGKIV